MRVLNLFLLACLCLALSVLPANAFGRHVQRNVQRNVFAPGFAPGFTPGFFTPFPGGFRRQNNIFVTPTFQTPVFPAQGFQQPVYPAAPTCGNGVQQLPFVAPQQRTIQLNHSLFIQ